VLDREPYIELLSMTEVTVPAHVRQAPFRSPEHPAHHDIAVPTHSMARRARSWTLCLLIVALLVWSWGPAEMYRAASLVTDWRNMAEFSAGHS
jgi:phosphonate transport system permease protein